MTRIFRIVIRRQPWMAPFACAWLYFFVSLALAFICHSWMQEPKADFIAFFFGAWSVIFSIAGIICGVAFLEKAFDIMKE